MNTLQWLIGGYLLIGVIIAAYRILIEFPKKLKNNEIEGLEPLNAVPPPLAAALIVIGAVVGSLHVIALWPQLAWDYLGYQVVMWRVRRLRKKNAEMINRLAEDLIKLINPDKESNRHQDKP